MIVFENFTHEPIVFRPTHYCEKSTLYLYYIKFTISLPFSKKHPKISHLTYELFRGVISNAHSPT